MTNNVWLVWILQVRSVVGMTIERNKTKNHQLMAGGF